MSSDIVIENAERITKVTLNGTVSRGDAIAWNGTGYVEADATDAATNLYAKFIAMDGGVSGDEINACEACTLYDADAPYTEDGALYVSGTAGALTHTRPATAADVIQQVGVAVDTYRARINIRGKHDFEVFIEANQKDLTSEPGLGVIDSPKWVGPALDSTTTERVYFQGKIPSNAIALQKARLIWNSIGETSMTISAAIIVAADGVTNTGDTGTAYAAAAPTALADNKICYNDIEAAFDADALKAGYNFNVEATPEGTIAGDLQSLGLYMRWTVVD